MFLCFCLLLFVLRFPLATDVEDGEVGQPGGCEYFSMYTGGGEEEFF